MSYYKILGLNKEPFSTSPDPQFFYRSKDHFSALNRLEISIRLRRGLSLILGDVGTGKTTLSRILLQNFAKENNFVFHLILDPSFKSEYQFLSYLIKIFDIQTQFNSTLDYKEALERYLYRQTVEDNKTIILMIDEGQKLTPDFLEILRVLLNYETNEYKMLQLVILSQLEILPRLKKVRNFFDRISLKYTINPFDEMQTKEMIEFRLKEAGYANKLLFSDSAVNLIYLHTQGYPRQINCICHDALRLAVSQDKNFIDRNLIEEVISENE
ncbi:MAG: AAA family ATPase [Candidatus Omnitrophota bacterium]